jgi:signal transduction histidine kinase/DNA-binding response OmpR family regulator
MRIHALIFLLFFLWEAPSVSTAQNAQIEQLEAQFQAIPSPERAVALSKAYQEHAELFFKLPQFNVDSAYFYSKKAINVLNPKEKAHFEGLSEAYFLLYSRFNGPFRKVSIKSDIDTCLKTARFYFAKIPYTSDATKLLNYQMLIREAGQLNRNGNVEEANKLFVQAFSWIQEQASPDLQAQYLLDKGNFYSRWQTESMKQSNDYYLEYLKRCNESNDPKKYERLVRLYSSLAWYHNNYGTPDSCDYYLDKQKELLPRINAPLWMTEYSANRANIYQRRKEFAKAAPLLKDCQYICEKYNLTQNDTYLFNTFLQGVQEMEAKNYDKAISFFNKGLATAQLINSSPRDAYQHLSQAYVAKEDYKKAYDYQQLMLDIETSTHSKTLEKSLKENELKLNIAQKNNELIRKNNERNLFIAVLLIALLLLGLSAFIFLRERRSKTKLAEQNRIIEEQSQALRQLDAAKTRFFANVSHELRTPLTLMLGPLSTAVKSGTLDDKNATLVALAQQNTQQLLGLVNEILDLTKLESGNMTVHEEATDVYNFLRRLVATFESYATQKNIKLLFDFDADAPRGLMLDKPKVERIFNNLLSNALKFTPKDGTISVKITHTPSAWQLAVTDTGRGIHPDDLPHVFNRFYQTNQTDIPVEGGTGIGLALSKELAQVLGGNLSVESTLGNGATFTLDLPKREVLGLSQTTQSIENDYDTVIFEENKTLETPSVSDGKNGQKNEKATILVVEDNPSLRAYLTLILSDKYNILTAENGKIGLNILENTPSVSLVISDIMMPVMDGFQLLEQLKADEKHQSLPIIMLTARAEMQDRLKALRIGVDDYLTKPFEEEELFARVKNLLNNAQMRQQFKQEALLTGSGNFESSPNLSIANIRHPNLDIEHPLSINAQKEQNLLSTDNLEWLTDLEKTVRQHIGNAHLSIDFIADEMHISRAQFYRRLQSLTGLTPNQYLQEILFNHARQLLEQRRVSSVKAASAAIGIQTVQYFSEQFKARFGKLPSDYLT